MSSTKKQQQAESIEHLTDVMNLAIGDTVYTSHHGSNGTFLKCFIVKGGVIYNITWHVARVIGVKPKDKDGEWMIHNPVYGMDRGFDVVYRLSSFLFRDLSEEERREQNPNHGSSDAGYLLNQRWL